jgi:membrane protein DedA with SNARE-associated domain
MPSFDLIALLHQYGYLALAAGTFFEGETMLALAGWAAREGYLSLRWVIALAALCGTIGDQFFFLLGGYFGPRMEARHPKLAVKTARMHELLRRYDAFAIVAVRFLYGLRIAGPIAIGSSGIHWARFALYNALGAIIWAIAVAMLGYTLGPSVEQFIRKMWGLQKDLLIAIVLAAIAVRLALWWRSRRSSSTS